MERKRNNAELRPLIEERLGPGARIGLFLVGLLPLLAPYEMLVRPFMEDRFPIFSIREGGFAALLTGAIYYSVAVGAAVLTGLFTWFALFGLSQYLLVDSARRLLVYRRGHSLSPLRESIHPFDQVEGLTVTEHHSSDGPPTYRIRVEVKNGENFEVGHYPSASAAESKVREIQSIIA